MMFALNALTFLITLFVVWKLLRLIDSHIVRVIAILILLAILLGIILGTHGDNPYSLLVVLVVGFIFHGVQGVIRSHKTKKTSRWDLGWLFVITLIIIGVLFVAPFLD